jgi:transcriptional regulator with XRE-family HTH domain
VVVVQPGSRPHGPADVPAGSDAAVWGVVRPPRGGGTAPRIVLGAQLRRLREARGITRVVAGGVIGASDSKISRLERGRVSFKERDVVDLLTLYGVTDERQRGVYLVLAGQANMPGWWHSYGDVLPGWAEPFVALEEAASRIRSFGLLFVPDLLQTEEYVHAVGVLRHPEATAQQIDRYVDLQMTRQLRLAAPLHPQLWVVMDEAVLYRPIGDGTRMLRHQLEHLMEMAERPDVAVQILPLRHGVQAAVGGSFTLLRFVEPDLPDVVYLEHLTTAVYLDKRDDVDRYLRAMNTMMARADPLTATADTLARIIKHL